MPPAPRSGRVWLFRVILLASPLLLLGALEIGVRVLGVGADSDDPFLNLNETGSIFAEVEIDGVRHYRVAHPEAYAQNDITFPVEKPAGGFRAFCIGGSASAGWPHHGGQYYSTYLQQALQNAYPGQSIEVLNVSAHAYASYRVRAIFHDVIRYDPDVILIWSGNNEFVETRRYKPQSLLRDAVRGLATHSRLFACLSAAVNDSLSGAAREDTQAFIDSQIERTALPMRADPQQYAEVVEHYEFSIDAIVAEAGEHGVPVRLLTVPVNLRDWEPNVSTHGVEGADLQRWRALYDEGCRELLEGRPAAAIAPLEGATEVDPQYADTWFRLARAHEGAGRREAAKDAYSKARDLDQTPFRATTPILDAIRRIAARHPHAELLDADAAMHAAADGPAPGFELFLDYVHPTKRGNLVVAELVYDDLLASKLVADAAPAVDRFTRADDGYAEASDLAVQNHVVTLLFLMHQYEAFLEASARLRTLLAPNTDPGSRKIVELIDMFSAGIRRFLDERARELRGEPHDADYREQHREFYREAYAALRAGQAG